MQLFNLKFPANASFLVGFLVDVSTFDIIPIEFVWYFLELPDRGSYNLNFASSGYEYVHAVENMGTSLLLIQVYILSVLICGFLFLFRNKNHVVEKYYVKSKNHLFWGAALRFLFEAYLELVLSIGIGIATMSWEDESFATMYNNVFTIIFAVIALLMPFYTSIFHGCHIDKMDEDNFSEKFGALY